MLSKTSLTLIGILFLLCGPSRAATVIDDTFDAGASPTTGDDPDDAGDAAWIAVSGFSSIAVNTDNALGSGNSLQGTVGSNSVNLMVIRFSAQSLSSVGDSLRVSFDYRWARDTAGGTDRIPVFGLYNSGATPEDYTDDVGYNAQVTSGNMRLYREVNTVDNPLTGGTETQIGTSPSYTYDGTARRFSLTLTRVAGTSGGDDLLLTLDVFDPATNSTISATATDTAVTSFLYDEFGLRSRATDFYLDNMEVEYLPASAIPEPGACALALGGIALAAATLRRRMVWYPARG